MALPVRPRLAAARSKWPASEPRAEAVAPCGLAVVTQEPLSGRTALTRPGAAHVLSFAYTLLFHPPAPKPEAPHPGNHRRHAAGARIATSAPLQSSRAHAQPCCSNGITPIEGRPIRNGGREVRDAGRYVDRTVPSARAVSWSFRKRVF